MEQLLLHRDQIIVKLNNKYKVAKDSESLSDSFTMDTFFVPKHLVFYVCPLWEVAVYQPKNMKTKPRI